MRKLLLIIIALFTVATLSAQTKKGRITGFIIGKSSKSPIEYATVALHRANSTQLITGTTTDSLGQFVLDKVTYGDYAIECSYIGCKTLKTSTFSISKSNQSIDLGILKLNDSSTTLGEVVVQGARSTYVQTIDKKIFNVGSDLMSGSGSVSDLMQNIPSVQVDVEGNISLRGNENVQVLINGKPSVMMKGVNRGSVLQQIPANSIERVEVITNPSAQFKPDGTSGIINLILKKERNAGFNGTLIGNAGNEDRYNSALSLGYNTSKLNITGNYGIRLDRRDRFTYNDRTLINTATGINSYVTQNTISKAPSTAHVAGLGLQWNIDAKDRFEVGSNYTYMTFPRTEDNSMLQRTEAQTIKEYNRHRYDDEKQKQVEGSAAYVHEFAKDHTLTVDYTYAMEDEVENNNYTNFYKTPIQSDSKDNTLIKQTNYQNLIRAIYENSFQNNNKLVLGYELEADKSNMRYFAEDLVNNSWIKNTDKSNDFVFTERVHSLYATYEQSFNKFGLLLGLRGE
jgi:Outer membrane receptor for ferrienterochelin and colicins